MDTDLQDTSLAERARQCLLSFNECQAHLACLLPQAQAAIEDQVGRFSIWASNIGVFAATRASLDYRLREAEDVQRLILGLLKTLDESIQQYISRLAPLDVSQDGSRLEKVPHISSLDTVLNDITEQINLLHQLSNMIRKASSKKQNIKAANSFVLRDEHGDDYGPRFRNLFALAIIRRSFPQCPESIQERLADAMLLRRKRILYRYSRYGKSPLRSTASAPTKRIPVSRNTQSVSQNSYQQSVIGTADLQPVSNTGTTPSVTSSRAITATTLDMKQWREVSATPSVVSQSTTIQLTHDEKLSFPAAPKISLLRRLKVLKADRLAYLQGQLDSIPNYHLFQQYDGHPPLEVEIVEQLRREIHALTAKTEAEIERDRRLCHTGNMEATCPYCCCTLSSATVMDNNKWTDHVKHDIDPYMCLFEDCDTSEVLYNHSHSWLKHMRQHNKRWCCSAKSHGLLVFESQSEYERHMVEKHKGTKSQLGLLAERHSRSSGPLFQSCPLCGEAGLDTSLESHMASHLIYLALKSLPSLDDGEDCDHPNGTSRYSDTIDGHTQSDILHDEWQNESQTQMSVDSWMSGEWARASPIDDPGFVGRYEAEIEGNHLDDAAFANPTLPPIPTFEGFKTQILQLNPRLAPALVERFASEQLHRYNRLIELQMTHALAVSQGTCSAAEGCFARGGQPKVLPSHITTSGTGTVQLQIAGRYAEDTITTNFDEPVLAVAQFPPGIPLPPDGVTRLPTEFECPYCFRIKKFLKPSDWTKHIHEDLQPFTCTFPSCQEPKSFKRKADWVRHEDLRHRHLEWWECSFEDCRHKCYRRDNFVQHLVREHKMQEPKTKRPKPAEFHEKPSNDSSTPELPEEAGHGQAVNQLWDLVNCCRHDTTKSPREEPCLFCGNICSSWKRLTVHLAQHLEQIALPVLTLIEANRVNSTKMAFSYASGLPADNQALPSFREVRKP
ncbi:hypothetical protein BDW59DRAFT_166463 [Aspergillus cavernicola]|uniref:C2H2-type domain-containing protein n=1 Tax=Aspergillus cavernicola TaxID=176166 RepID=A0ABR4HLY1_9EURO